jgi:hypothetical protein
MILSNFEWTLLRSNISWWLVFLLIVPLKALANCQRSYWCINGVNDASNAFIAGVIDTGEVGDQWHRWYMTLPVSTTLVTCFAGVIDTGKYMLHRRQWHRWVIFCRCRWNRWSSLKQWKCQLPVLLTSLRNYSLPFLLNLKLPCPRSKVKRRCPAIMLAASRSTEIIKYLCD